MIRFVSTFSIAQETTIDTTKHWTRKGVFTFLANQSSFSNWQAGGQNNFAGNVGFNYDFNYKNGDWNWDNKWIVSYGLTKIKGADTQKTDDRIELNSLLVFPKGHEDFLPNLSPLPPVQHLHISHKAEYVLRTDP